MDALRRALIVAMLPLAAHATITRVGKAHNFGGSSTSSITVSYAATTGNTLYIGCAPWGTTPTTESASDGTNTYSLVGTGGASGNAHTYLHKSPNVTGGTFTFTCSGTGTTNFWDIFVAEYSGLGTSATQDGSTVTAASTGNPVTTAGQTTTNASDLLLALWGIADNSGTPTFTPGGGFSNVDISSNCNAAGCAGLLERIVSSTGTYTASMDRGSTSAGYSILQAAWKASGGGGTTKVSASVQ